MQAHHFVPLALSALMAPALGCPAAAVTHIPDPHQPHMAVSWRTDFEAARAQAMLEQKPILLVGASGEVDGLL